MANTLQKRAKRISLVLTLAAVLFTVVDNYLYLCHDINITPVATPVIIILVVSIVLCGVLQRYFYRWLIKYSLFPSANRQKLEADKTERTRAVVTEQAERDETAGGPTPRRTYGGHPRICDRRNRALPVAEGPRHPPHQHRADGLRPDGLLPAAAPLRSPELRHLAWNIGERLHLSLEERARFIKLSFPHELNNATVEYLQRNLRVAVPSHIPIDIPDEDDFRFHLELIGGHRKK